MRPGTRAHSNTSLKQKGTRRVCLRCDQVFLSEGSFNRLCKVCREYLRASPTPEEVYVIGYL
jgi:hypothetical protein